MPTVPYSPDQLADLMGMARDVRELEHQLRVKRQLMDARIYYLAEAGAPITDLAETASVSRPTVYAAIRRYGAANDWPTSGEPYACDMRRLYAAA